jgi:hypothetical protein
MRAGLISRITRAFLGETLIVKASNSTGATVLDEVG